MTRTTETAIDRYIQIFDGAAHDQERSTSSAGSSRRTPACSSPNVSPQHLVEGIAVAASGQSCTISVGIRR